MSDVQSYTELNLSLIETKKKMKIMAVVEAFVIRFKLTATENGL